MQPTADFFAQAQATLEKVVRDYRPKLLAAQGNTKVELKSDDSPVTALDRELEGLMTEALLKLDSSVGIEGEELGKQGNTETFWLIDPIDGTANFIRGLPSVFNMATLIDGAEPVFTFVYKVVSDELYIAAKQMGATKNGERLQVSDRPLERSLIELSSSRISQSQVAKLIAAVEPHVNRIRRFDDFSYVADGRVDANIVYKSGGQAWDYAPQALLVAEAGGRVANLGSDTYDYRNYDLLAAGPRIFDELMEIINGVVEQAQA